MSWLGWWCSTTNSAKTRRSLDLEAMHNRRGALLTDYEVECRASLGRARYAAEEADGSRCWVNRATDPLLFDSWFRPGLARLSDD